MLKFYYSGAPNPTKVALFLEETGTPYDPIPIDTRKGGCRSDRKAAPPALDRQADRRRDRRITSDRQPGSASARLEPAQRLGASRTDPALRAYRRRLFDAAFDTKLPDGRPVFNLVLAGRGKKNWKSADLVLAGLYCLVARREAYQGNDGLILGNDEAQAGDDLSLAKKLVSINPSLAAELEIRVKEIVRRDGQGTLRILPARDVIGLHGKTAEFIGYDEVRTLSLKNCRY